MNSSPIASFAQRARSRLALVWVTCLLLSVACPAKAETPVISAQVSKIVDGDTFTLRGESRRIRIWGLDAPERDEAGASAATSALNSFIAGETLICRIRDIDRYSRLVSQCYLPDGRDVAAAMIKGGTATEYCRYSAGYYGTC